MVAVILIWLKKPIYFAVFWASLLFAVLFAVGPIEYAQYVWNGTINPDNFNVVLVMLLVMILEGYLDKHGYLRRLLDSLQQFCHSRKSILVVLPILIGLIPSAGGALFSAPMVDELTKKEKIDADEKAAINFYYRHMTEMWVPLHPGTIVVCSLSGFPVGQIVLTMLPLALLGIIFGLPLLKNVAPTENHSKRSPGLIKEILLSFAPVGIILIMVVGFSVNVWHATLIVLAPLLIYRKYYHPQKLWELLHNSVKIKTLIAVWAILVFKEFLVDSGAIAALKPVLAQLPVPEIAMLCIMAFLIGLLAGMTVVTMAINGRSHAYLRLRLRQQHDYAHASLHGYFR